MQVHINGEVKHLPPLATVSVLLQELGLQGKRVAVELNGSIVPKSLHETTTLEEGNRIEIVVAVGGG